MSRDAFTIKATSTNQSFTLLGGSYCYNVAASSWSSGSVTWNLVDGAGNVIPVVAAFTANALGHVWLAPGSYTLVLASSTGVTFSVVGVGTE